MVHGPNVSQLSTPWFNLRLHSVRLRLLNCVTSFIGALLRQTNYLPVHFHDTVGLSLPCYPSGYCASFTPRGVPVCSLALNPLQQPTSSWWFPGRDTHTADRRPGPGNRALAGPLHLQNQVSLMCLQPQGPPGMDTQAELSRHYEQYEQ